MIYGWNLAVCSLRRSSRQAICSQYESSRIKQSVLSMKVLASVCPQYEGPRIKQSILSMKVLASSSLSSVWRSSHQTVCPQYEGPLIKQSVLQYEDADNKTVRPQYVGPRIKQSVLSMKVLASNSLSSV